MNQSFNKTIEQHNIFFTGEHASDNVKRIVTPGQQKLIYLFRLGSFGKSFQLGEGRKALDAGCGSGYNLVTLHLLGWDTYGFDISDALVANAEQNVKKYHSQAIIKKGTNQSIPFKENEFSMLLSMNSIHYAESEMEVCRAMEEFARVLKPGGRIYLTTTHPSNWIFEDASETTEQFVHINQPGDYRHGMSMLRLKDESELYKLAEPFFNEIKIGIDQTELFVKTIKSYAMTGIRK